MESENNEVNKEQSELTILIDLTKQMQTNLQLLLEEDQSVLSSISSLLQSLSDHIHLPGNETPPQFLILFKQIQQLLQKKIQLEKIPNDQNDSFYQYLKICLDCSNYSLSLIQANPTHKLYLSVSYILILSRLQQEDLFISISLFLRFFISSFYQDPSSSLFPSSLASIFFHFSQIQNNSKLPQSILLILDDCCWFFLRHQIPSYEVLYNEILQFRIVRSIRLMN